MNLLFSNTKREQSPCIAHVSYSEMDNFGALGERERRGIPLFSPRGISYRPCEGDQLLLQPVEGTDVCVGVRITSNQLEQGELLLSSSGGAEIHLRADGSISLNGLIISKQGIIQGGGS